MDSERYIRQLILAELGPAGQERLAAGRVTLIGCGALGTAQAELLVRAGVGFLRLVDRDVVVLGNLPRQHLFDEADVAARWPKAGAAARHLGRINHAVRLEPMVTNVAADNVEALITGVDVVLDATDNFETRYVLNDACVKARVPWIFGGVLGSDGVVMPILPGRGPCLRCRFPEPPVAGTYPTPDQRGILNTVPAIVAACQATLAYRLLTGVPPPAAELLAFNAWAGTFRSVAVRRNPACVCCGLHQYGFLNPAGKG